MLRQCLLRKKRLNQKPIEDKASIFDTRQVPEEELAPVVTPPEVEEDSDLAIINEKEPSREEEIITPGGSQFKTELEEPVENRRIYF